MSCRIRQCADALTDHARHITTGVNDRIPFARAYGMHATIAIYADVFHVRKGARSGRTAIKHGERMAACQGLLHQMSPEKPRAA